MTDSRALQSGNSHSRAHYTETMDDSVFSLVVKTSDITHKKKYSRLKGTNYYITTCLVFSSKTPKKKALGWYAEFLLKIALQYVHEN